MIDVQGKLDANEVAVRRIYYMIIWLPYSIHLHG